MGISAGRRRRSSAGPSRSRSDDRSLPGISELTKCEQTSMIWFSVPRREIASVRNDVFVIWVSHCLRLGAGIFDWDAKAAIKVCRQSILTNEKYRHLISTLLI